MIWLYVCLVVACIYPVWDGRKVLSTAGKVAWKALRGQAREEPSKDVNEGSDGVIDELSDGEKSRPAQDST